MSKTVLDGETFKSMIIQATYAIDDKKQKINELNVFPVPDGDTGTNMSLTMSAALNELKNLKNPTLSEAANVTASALLRGARGNSGVILSLLFRGIAKYFKALESSNAKQLASSLREGVDTAYKAVMKPAEGTILTVSRVSADTGIEAASSGSDIKAVLDAVIEKAKEALLQTVNQNPVLKKAGVVDAGAYGYIVILEAMRSAFLDKPLIISEPVKTTTDIESIKSADFSDFSTEDIKFFYCTEFIVNKSSASQQADKMREKLNSIGDSLVLVDDDDIIKIHVHTNEPDAVLSEGLKLGFLSRIKIENMREQHTNKLFADGTESVKTAETADLKELKKYGFVAVTAGSGIKTIFKDLGVDSFVEGGQTMNPSTGDILSAVHNTFSETVFVLPNNKNIILAAEQAAKLTDKNVVVIPTKTIPQGIAAILAFDESADLTENSKGMMESAKGVLTGQVTYASRDSCFDGKLIKEGDYIGLLESSLLCSDRNVFNVIDKLSDKMTGDRTSITIIYGADANEAEAEEVKKLFMEKAGDSDINIVSGGQPVYNYIIAAE